LAQRYLRREADQGAEGKTEERGEEEEEEARAGSKLAQRDLQATSNAKV
jgi:hypothetical protein